LKIITIAKKSGILQGTILLEINNCEHSIATITIAAGLSRNYAVEISKGIKLAKYVKFCELHTKTFGTSSE
jgi:hypothetical protein